MSPIHAQISQGQVIVLLVKAGHEVFGVVLLVLDGACTLPDHDILLLEVSASPQLDLLASTEDVHDALDVTSVVDLRVEVSLGVLLLLLDAVLLGFSERRHERRDVLRFEISIRLQLLLLVGTNQATSKKLSSILSSCGLCHLSNASFQETVSCFFLLRHRIVFSTNDVTFICGSLGNDLACCSFSFFSI